MKTDIARMRLLADVACAVLCALASRAGAPFRRRGVRQSKPITFTGTVQKVEWMNPHIYTHVEVKDADGKMVVYRVEGGSAERAVSPGLAQGHAENRRRGDGDRHARQESGVDEMGVATITTADGKKVFSGVGPASAAAATP